MEMAVPPENSGDEVYNILPSHNMLADHPALQFPEVRAAAAALKTVSGLPIPPSVQWNPDKDFLDWLGAFFGFQKDNVRNQRESLILHLANSQMRLQPPPDDIGRLEPIVVRKLRKKILGNYEDWCSYLARKSNVRISNRRPADVDERRELLYLSLYLLIWGEAANLKFMPECLCYIFHHMAMELNRILEDYPSTGQPPSPVYMGEDAFLNRIVTPLYRTVEAEAEGNHGGKAPHSVCRNYDDLNEYFWNNRCFEQLGWPLKLDSDFFVQTEKETKQEGGLQKRKVGKTGFVEQRSFWNIFRSFDRLWIMYILFLQAAIIVAWHGDGYPWVELKNRDIQVQVLSVCITWAGLRILQSLIDAGMQYSLVSRRTPLQGLRMLLKTIVAAGWTVFFAMLYIRMWKQRNHDFQWSREANRKLLFYLQAALVFIAPEVLALLLLIIPWVGNFMEKTNWRLFHVWTWWFHSRTFIGRGLREGMFTSIRNTLFWVTLLAAKFSFSYFFQIKPMVSPTKELLKIHQIPYKLHEFFENSNKFAIGVLWAPVLLIYFMDTQIWYSILSSIVGALVGLFNDLGEIRNIQQLRLRFRFFASATLFNLIPEEPLFRTNGSLKVKLLDAIKRLQLRYGYKQIETNQVEARRFAIIWNEFLKTFQEEDIVSELEVELLEMPQNRWNVPVIQWPCFVLCNELWLALRQATILEGTDKKVWRKLCKNEYRRCAVIETYNSVKHFLQMIVREDSEEHSIIVTLFKEIDESLSIEKFTEKYRMSELPQIHSKLIEMVDVFITKPSPRDRQKVINTLQNLYDFVIRDFPEDNKGGNQWRHDGLVPQRNGSKLLFEDAVELPDVEEETFYRQLRRLRTILTTRESMQDVPRNLEARRRLAFFSNSVFMNMPHARQVDKMLAFSVLTPYYQEDVIYDKRLLCTEIEHGLSIVFYLKKIYPDEWDNFLERMHKKGINEPELWTNHLRELRLWASYRGQTLARTVRGMMYYHKALKFLAFLDSASEMVIRDRGSFNESVSTASGCREDTSGLSSRRSSSENSGVRLHFNDQEDASALIKFTYVVACQMYGAQKAKGDRRAKDITYLMKNNEALRVAYVDVVYTGSHKQYFSVLVKYDQDLLREVEIYRVRLPGPMKLGEGKPENQNHALIFTRGEAVQTIDMNQDNYFEEALKMRNLLQEFTKYYGIRKPTILGVREHVFTGSVSPLARFMCAQEASFVTLGQRVLANPLKVRMHYGHPDVFDRLWFLSRGGISKASPVINISEDVFAGFNCTLRGGNVTHHEYIQVGKGRDVGLNQISMFEAKIASGNGEQVLSRDMYRLGHRLDFFRMLSFYHSTIGFYFNTLLVVLTVYAFLWGRVYLTLSGGEETIVIEEDITNNKAIQTVLKQQFIVQFGLLTALPMIIENYLEHGFLSAIWEFLTMQLHSASAFYAFSMGTRSHYFGRTILHGGAKYRATGRGFVVQHKRFAENYRLYARSHFVKAIELGLLLIIYASDTFLRNDTFAYILLTISTWFLVLSWITGPFLFNPSGFDWFKIVDDFHDFMNWIWFKAGILSTSDQSWEVWWNEEHEHLRTTGLWGIVLEILLDTRFFFLQCRIAYGLGILVYIFSWIYGVVALAIYVGILYAHGKYAAKKHIYYRSIQALVISCTILVIVLLLHFTPFKFVDLLISLLAFIPTGWGLISIAQALRPSLTCSIVWEPVVAVARLYEFIFGLIVMIPVAILSWLPGFQSMQTRILFNKAFSRGVQMSRIHGGKKSTTGF